MDGGESVVRRAAPARTFLRVQLRPWRAVGSLLLLFASVLLAWVQPPYPNPLMPTSERTWSEWFLYPVESHPALRLDAAPSRLLGFAVTPDGKHAWAVGNAGSIVATTNGGRTWEAQASGVQVALFAVHAHADGRRAWAVGRRGVILATEDGGRNWKRQPTATSSVLRDVQFDAQGRRGWAVSEAGELLATHDGGGTWSAPRVLAAGTMLGAVHFLSDARRGWIVGGNGTILATATGGDTWTRQPNDDRTGLGAIYMHQDGLRGWAVGNGGTVLLTTDGGREWTNQPNGISRDLYGVRFAADGRHGWAWGGEGTMVRTADGGRTWTPQPCGVHTDLVAGGFSDDRHGWIVGARGTVIASRDGGDNWSAQLSAAGATLLGVQFLEDGREGWAVAGNGMLLTTADGGAQWAGRSLGTPYDLLDVHFTRDGALGWIVGEHGRIFASVDHGRNWTAQESGIDTGLKSVYFLADGQHGWAVGADGVVLGTRDGGASWQVLYRDSQTFAYLQAVHFDADGKRGWIAGSEGIMLSSDGGESWTFEPKEARRALNALYMAPDARRGWAVGEDGAILRTVDGGRNWASVPSGIQTDLVTVGFAADGRKGWAAGDAGTILVTDDGGRLWRTVPSHVGTVRQALWISSDGSHGWVVGYPPALLSTTDGGAKWSSSNWPLRHARYPAPWFWCSLALAALLWHGALVRRATASERGATAMATSDAPALRAAHDRLQFWPLARGISRFLRNEATEAPLTVAISGEWGSGKSSLMHLVCDDLRRHGGRPVWFNAWHHQKDEQLLAALLNAIRVQALPSSWTPDGWVFRLRLLYLRSKKHFLLTSTVLLLFAAVSAFMLTHEPTAWASLWARIQAHASWMHAASDGKPPEPGALALGAVALQLATAIAALVALGHALTAFGANPAVLLARTTERFRIKDASTLTNFRSHFAEQFKEVTQALPARITIVIDDLDRCRAEAVLDVMEAVNFVVSSGPCFVIFGMATNRVQAALAQSFEKVALEVVEGGTAPAFVQQASSKEDAARLLRHNYARDYMEKLVNLEVCVPACLADRPHLLFDAAKDEERPFPAMARAMLRFWPFLLCALAIGAGIWIGSSDLLSPTPQQRPKEQVASLRNEPAPVPTASPAPQRADTRGPAAAAAPQRYVPLIQPGQSVPVDWRSVAVPVALAMALGLAFTVFRLRTNLYQVHDSEAFRNALAAWLPLVQRRRRTPRALKRFGNRIRYLAMLQQPLRLDESRWDQIQRKLAGRRPLLPADGGMPVTLEDHIVALGALHEVFGDAWRECALGHYPEGPLADAARACQRRYLENDGALPWPPTAAELDAFALALRGIRIPSA